jgi:hypothetical protein
MKVDKQIFISVYGYIIDRYKFKVDYYKNSYLPELSEYTGRSQSDHLESAKERLQDTIRDMKDYLICLDNTNDIPIDDYISDLIYAIQMYMKDCYRLVFDFCENPYIVGTNLRRIIKAKNQLIELDSKYEIYSTKWLCKVNTII